MMTPGTMTALSGVVTLLLVAWAGVSSRPPAWERQQFERGREYVREELGRAEPEDRPEVVARLRREMELGIDLDPSSFEMGMSRALQQYACGGLV